MPETKAIPNFNPQNETAPDYEEYLKQRQILVEENANLIGNVLNEKELRLDQQLSQYKQELKDLVDEQHLYKMPVLRNEVFWHSQLWDFCKKLPKGSDLHVHAGALLPAWKLVDFVCSRKELVVDLRNGHIYNTAEAYDSAHCFPLQEALNKGLTTSKQIESFWSLLGLQHTDNVWDYFENLFTLQDSMEYDYETYYAYYLWSFRYYVSLHITHIEIHSLFSAEYEKSANYIQALRRAYYEVKAEHPDLVVSLICAGLKHQGINESVIQTYLNNALQLKQSFKDEFNPEDVHEFIIGFDLFNEEDASLPLKDIAPLLLNCKKQYPEFQFYLHCGESLQAQSDNLIDAYLLGAGRVGHGMNLYRYPNLLTKYADSEICLECCPISNQSLRYVKDLRLHPGLEYLRRGVTIALCSDDPAFQEKESLSDDFFAAITCWDLSLADVKQLCINSILYAGVDQGLKSQILKSWQKSWNQFIDSMLLP